MESFSGDTEDSAEDIAGNRKSKLKSLKTRFFGRSKRAGGAVNTSFSQSASDITAGKGLGSDEDLACSEGMMGSRALSHDSIFSADQVLADDEPVRVSSQENVHSRIKALQMKLQQQRMHLGPPPMVVPIRRPEDLGSCFEDLPRSPPDISAGDITTQEALSKLCSRPLSPILKPAATKPVPSTPSPTHPPSVPSSSSSTAVESPLDFSSPAWFTPCLDTSAARHRMSVKPRNQRASTRRRLAPNNISHPECVKEQAQRLRARAEVPVENEDGGAKHPIKPQQRPSKSQEMELTTLEAAPKLSSITFSQKDHVLLGGQPSVSTQVLRVKPHIHGDVVLNEGPHSPFIQSEVKEKRDSMGDFETQVKFHDKRNALHKVGTTDMTSKEVSSDQFSSSIGSAVAPRSSPVYQRAQAETENIRGIKRAAPGSGSFHFSITAAKNRDEERPRSSSFVGVAEHTGARKKIGGGTEHAAPSSMSEQETRFDLQARGEPLTVGRVWQEGSLHRSPVGQWDGRESLKRVESVTKKASTDTGALEATQVESSQRAVERVVEAREEVQEEEGKTVFGFKLRPTSHSMRGRSDGPSKHQSKAPCEEPKTREISDNSTCTLNKLPASISCTPWTSGDVRLTDPTPSGFTPPVGHDSPSASNPHNVPAEAQTASLTAKEVQTPVAAPQEPQPPAHMASSEVSWMSLAMEKTRSLHQLFTSRFPRDLTAGQAATRPQAQAQPAELAEASKGAQTQTSNQPSTDAVKAETAQGRGPPQTVKSFTAPSGQQKTSTAAPRQSNVSKEPQTAKEANEPQSHAAQPVSHPQTANPWAAQSPSRSSQNAHSASQLAQGGVSPPPAQSQLPPGQQLYSRGNRGLHPASQLTSTASPLTAASSAAAPVRAIARGEGTDGAQEKESPSPSGKRVVWAGSVSEKAAFLEKRAEWTSLSGTKGVESKKAQTEPQTSGESPAAVIKTQSKDTKADGGPGVEPAESSPTKVPDRPPEDKWLRKNIGSSSSPSSSPTLPSALQSMSDSGQPSWMELAKRKSMAWSDKNMD